MILRWPATSLIDMIAADRTKMIKVVEDCPTAAIQLPQSILWSRDSNYLLVGDYDIRKLRVPMEPRDRVDAKLPLTKLQTYFGGIQQIRINDRFICTVDQQGFLYVLARLD